MNDEKNNNNKNLNAGNYDYEPEYLEDEVVDEQVQNDREEFLIEDKQNKNTDSKSNKNQEKFGKKEYKNLKKEQEETALEEIRENKRNENNWKEKNGSTVKPSQTSKEKIQENKLDNVKAKVYQVSHPIDAAKENVKEKAKSGAKKVAKTAGEAVLDTIKKGAMTAAKWITGVVLSNPVVLAIIAFFVFVLFIVLFFFTTWPEIESYNENCDVIPMNSTPLSRSEFVEKVQSYYGNSNSSGRIFAEHAGSIYDIAIRNSINPELVVIRAALEGFSPGQIKNNYWGLGCYNGMGVGACISYASFDDGVLGYVKNISKYSTVTEMMMSYAYIGDYWFNPGSSSNGGCYYFPYIKEYLSHERANQVEIACAKNRACSGSGCLKTTDEDQTAYATYQVQDILLMREKIFGLSAYECDNYASTCTIYDQTDSRWANVRLGNSGYTMYDSGCAITSVAIGIACSGTDLTIDNFDAGVFVQKLNEGNCLPGGGIMWGCDAITKIAPGVKYLGNKISLSGMSVDEKRKLIESYDQSQYFVITHFVNSKHPRGHFVVYESSEGSNYIAKDPAGGKLSTLPFSEAYEIVVYSYTPGTKQTSSSSSSYSNWTKEINTSTSSSIQVSMLNKPIKSILTKKEYDSLNNSILNGVTKAGVGTNKAIVTAAVTPIKYLAEKKKVIIPYTYGGGHGGSIYSSLNGANIQKTTDTYFGVDPDWGTKINYVNNWRFYQYGPDCSAWVVWVLRNAGIEIGTRTAATFANIGTVHKMDGSYTGKPGDLMGNSGHIMVVVGVDKKNKKYYVSQAMDGNHGTIISTINFVNNTYNLIDISSYIKNHKMTNYSQKFKSGVLGY